MGFLSCSVEALSIISDLKSVFCPSNTLLLELFSIASEKLTSRSDIFRFFSHCSFLVEYSQLSVELSVFDSFGHSVKPLEIVALLWCDKIDNYAKDGGPRGGLTFMLFLS